MAGPAKSDSGEMLAGVVRRNIETLSELKKDLLRRRKPGEKLADTITAFVGSMPFVYLHAALLIFWLVANTRVVPGLPVWDPYPFVMLAMAASVEALFLSTFVLMGQNRMAELADKRADLDVQINLLAEHEITRLVTMVEAISQRLGVDVPVDDLEEIKADVAPERVVAQIERKEADEA